MNDSKMQIFATRLKELRTDNGMTQKEFAEEMHWDVNTYRKIETGCSLLTSDKAQMLYDKYEIDITYLLTGNKPDFDNHLRQLWLTGRRVESQNENLSTRFFLPIQI